MFHTGGSPDFQGGGEGSWVQYVCQSGGIIENQDFVPNGNIILFLTSKEVFRTSWLTLSL